MARGSGPHGERGKSVTEGIRRCLHRYVPGPHVIIDIWLRIIMFAAVGVGLIAWWEWGR